MPQGVGVQIPPLALAWLLAKLTELGGRGFDSVAALQSWTTEGHAIGTIAGLRWGWSDRPRSLLSYRAMYRP